MAEHARVYCPIQHLRFNPVQGEYEPAPCPLAKAPHPLVVGDAPLDPMLAGDVDHGPGGLAVVATFVGYVLAAIGTLFVANSLLGGL